MRQENREVTRVSYGPEINNNGHTKIRGDIDWKRQNRQQHDFVFLKYFLKNAKDICFFMKQQTAIGS
ncbi:hypothetical protein [Desulforhopalus singaporensis]|uniref:hypothetical protein n=1 Tax=Desulforhopalus singaporensis TaxID=91360 RepID=UPI000B80B12A|nr:hypothetical protein [Desulforhopalus singaporensis]